MNTNALAKNYGSLTPEERFRLIVAAGDRGDETEQHRLTDTGQRITLSMPAHAPYAHAFHELLFWMYIELLEDAALYHDCFAQRDKQLRDSIIEAAKKTKKTKATTPRTKDRTRKKGALEWPDWHHSGRMAYAVGFLFKVKLEGWKLFCARLNVSPVALWEQMDLPGLDRLKSAWALIHAGAVFPSAAEMLRWVNEVRPAGDPEYTGANIMTAAWFAAGLDASFRERVEWWGG
jgi:hypothetical protein